MSWVNRKVVERRASRHHVLPNGRACMHCRTLKKKCDAVSPRCGRCVQYDLACESQVIAPREKRLRTLQQQLAGLESKLATLAKAHDRGLIMEELLQQAGLLSLSSLSPRSQSQELAIWPYSGPVATAETYEPPTARIFLEESEAGYRPTFPASALCHLSEEAGVKLNGELLPYTFTLLMVRLFLPFHVQFYFFMKPRAFLAALALPQDDPESIHPALQYAIYYATLWVVGGDFTTFREYCLAQARLHLSRSLAEVDRLTHFLWANVILGSCFMLEGRMNDAYVTVSSCVKFAIACGLHVVHHRNKSPPISAPLLPPPVNHAEMMDRTQLSYAIYTLDRTLSMVSGFPSTIAGHKGALSRTSDDHGAKVCDDGEFLKTASTESLQQEMDQLCAEDDLPRGIKILIIYERVEQLAHRAKQLSNAELESQISLYSQALAAHSVLLLSLEDTWGLDPFESVSRLNPKMIFHQTNYHGCVMLLHSMKAKDGDMRARGKMIESARVLAELCPLIQGQRGVRPLHGLLLLMLHMMNAARVFAAQLQVPELKEDDKLFAICVESLRMLVSLIRDMTGIYPSWAHVINPLRDVMNG